MARIFVSHVATALAAGIVGLTVGRLWQNPTIAPATFAEAPASAALSASRTPPAPNNDARLGAKPEDRVQAAVQAVQRAPDRASRLTGFALRLRELEPAQFPALFAALRTTRSPESPEIFAMLCSMWAAHDGPAAFAAGRALATGDGDYGALHAAILGWSRSDPSAARTALAGAGWEDLKTDEMAAFVQGWAAADARAAEDFLGRHVSTSSEEELPAAVQRGFEAIAQARIAADPTGALAWYGSLAAPLRERLRQTVLAQLTAVDPRRAAEWLARDVTAQLGASDLLPLLRGLGLEGFEQQFAWARGTANPVSRESALAAVVWESAPAQLVPLGEWLASRCDDASLSPAVSAYALQVVRKSPNAAITWALSLESADLRRETLNTVAAEWITINPRAARDWAQRTGLVNYESLVR